MVKTNSELAACISAQRKRLGMSRYSLIKNSGLSTNTVKMMEKEGRCNFLSLLKVADVLNLSIKIEPNSDNYGSTIDEDSNIADHSGDCESNSTNNQDNH